jgi:hypothetical protein
VAKASIIGRHGNCLHRSTAPYREARMSYDILKNLGLDHLDATSPDFIRTLERMQKEAWQSLKGEPASASDDGPETIVG